MQMHKYILQGDMEGIHKRDMESWRIIAHLGDELLGWNTEP